MFGDLPCPTRKVESTNRVHAETQHAGHSPSDTVATLLTINNGKPRAAEDTAMRTPKHKVKRPPRFNPRDKKPSITDPPTTTTAIKNPLEDPSEVVPSSSSRGAVSESTVQWIQENGSGINSSRGERFPDEAARRQYTQTNQEQNSNQSTSENENMAFSGYHVNRDNHNHVEDTSGVISSLIVVDSEGTVQRIREDRSGINNSRGEGFSSEEAPRDPVCSFEEVEVADGEKQTKGSYGQEARSSGPFCGSLFDIQGSQSQADCQKSTVSVDRFPPVGTVNDSRHESTVNVGRGQESSVDNGRDPRSTVDGGRGRKIAVLETTDKTISMKINMHGTDVDSSIPLLGVEERNGTVVESAGNTIPTSLERELSINKGVNVTVEESKLMCNSDSGRSENTANDKKPAISRFNPRKSQKNGHDTGTRKKESTVVNGECVESTASCSSNVSTTSSCCSNNRDKSGITSGFEEKKDGLMCSSSVPTTSPCSPHNIDKSVITPVVEQKKRDVLMCSKNVATTSPCSNKIDESVVIPGVEVSKTNSSGSNRSQAVAEIEQSMIPNQGDAKAMEKMGTRENQMEASMIKFISPSRVVVEGSKSGTCERKIEDSATVNKLPSRVVESPKSGTREKQNEESATKSISPPVIDERPNTCTREKQNEGSATKSRSPLCSVVEPPKSDMDVRQAESSAVKGLPTPTKGGLPKSAIYNCLKETSEPVITTNRWPRNSPASNRNTKRESSNAVFPSVSGSGSVHAEPTMATRNRMSSSVAVRRPAATATHPNARGIIAAAGSFGSGLTNKKPFQDQEEQPAGGCCERPMSNSSRRRLNIAISISHVPRSTKYVDSHCHLDYMRYKKDKFDPLFYKWEDMLLYQKFNPPTFAGCIWNIVRPEYVELNRKWLFDMIKDDRVLGVTVGCHPHYSDSWNEYKSKSRTRNPLGSMKKFVTDMVKDAKKNKVCAIGECGLDSEKNALPLSVQLPTLREQLSLAKDYDLPVVIHCRGGPEVEEICVKAIKEIMGNQAAVHRHCFRGSWKTAEKWMDAFPGCYFGFTPGVVQSNEEELEAIRKIPITRMLLETDAPFFAADCYEMSGEKDPKGVPCSRMAHPYQASVSAAFIASVKNLPIEVVMQTTLMNTLRFYRLDRNPQFMDEVCKPIDEEKWKEWEQLIGGGKKGGGEEW